MNNRIILLLFCVSIHLRVYSQVTLDCETKVFKDTFQQHGILLCDTNDGKWFVYEKNKYPPFKIALKAIVQYKKDKIIIEQFRYPFGKDTMKFVEEFSIENKKLIGNGINNFYFNHILYDESVYKNGAPDGKAVSYYPNGKIKEIKNYKKGLLNGKFKSYYDNGKLKSKGRYKNNKPIGRWICK